MTDVRTWLLIALGGFGIYYVVILIGSLRKKEKQERSLGWMETGIGFITNFFDTLGIGSFATTTAMYRFRKLVSDEMIPGTLNVGHTLPTLAQAFIYISIVEVDMKTLVFLIASSVLGMWLGAGVVARWPRRNIQLGMGIALLAAAGLMLMTALKASTTGGEAMALEGMKLWIGVIGNFVLGALMSMGIGLYGPCLIMISLLGMNPKAAFPIMMGSCAFLMPVGSKQFIQKQRYNARAVIGLMLGGIPAVLIAAYIVREMNLQYVRWLVVIVVVYTALMLLRSAKQEKKVSLSSEKVVV